MGLSSFVARAEARECAAVCQNYQSIGECHKHDSFHVGERGEAAKTEKTAEEEGSGVEVAVAQSADYKIQTHIKCRYGNKSYPSSMEVYLYRHYFHTRGYLYVGA